MATANPTWGSPRIVSELRKLGIEVAKATVERYMIRRRTLPSPTRRAFLATHVNDLVSIDFFTVATVRFEILFVLLILAHERRRVRHLQHHRAPGSRAHGPPRFTSCRDPAAPPSRPSHRHHPPALCSPTRSAQNG